MKKKEYATEQQLKELFSLVERAKREIEIQSKYNPKRLKENIVRMKLSKGASEIVKEIKKKR
jgi:uncharacterized HAD superfamily protein